MTGLFTKLRNLFVAGFFFLLPAFVALIIASKVWAALTSGGARLASIFGLKSLLGLGATHIFTGILMIAICLLCGLLVRVSFMANFSQRAERTLAKYLPGRHIAVCRGICNCLGEGGHHAAR